MKHSTLFTIIFAALTSATAQAQIDDFDEFKNALTADFDEFTNTQQREFDEFRQKCNEEFANFMRAPWKDIKVTPKKPKPKEEVVPPVVYDKTKPITIISTPRPIREVIKPQPPKPQPMPIKPIEELPVVGKPRYPTLAFSYFGTDGKVRFLEENKLRLNGISENDIADAWMKLSGEGYINLLHDCLKIREEKHLCDWAYLMMLQEMAQAVCGANSNEATLLTAYACCQSGYKVRLARAGEKLRMLYACDYDIYDIDFFYLDGEKYYPLGNEVERLHICEAKFPQEKSMSLQVPQTPLLDWNPGEARTLQSEEYPDMRVQLACNKNSIDFYATYPSSEVGDNFMTRWAMYANTPFEKGISESLYPQLRAQIKGVSEKEAVERLLNWVQTSLIYEYDDKVWGGDRAFFPEESLFYPYADCEDRSILFTRIVRDLLGLKCVLVYYPGHLASAVCIPGDVAGDFLEIDGNRYFICDPTYIGAGIGMTMTAVQGLKTTVIELED